MALDDMFEGGMVRQIGVFRRINYCIFTAAPPPWFQTRKITLVMIRQISRGEKHLTHTKSKAIV